MASISAGDAGVVRGSGAGVLELIACGMKSGVTVGVLRRSVAEGALPYPGHGLFRKARTPVGRVRRGACVAAGRREHVAVRLRSATRRRATPAKQNRPRMGAVRERRWTGGSGNRGAAERDRHRGGRRVIGADGDRGTVRTGGRRIEGDGVTDAVAGRDRLGGVRRDDAGRI